MSTFFQRNGAYGDKRKSKQPSKAARQSVRNAFDQHMLAHICETWDFEDWAERVDLPDGERDDRKRFYYFKDNGSDVLAIAHLDSVQEDGRCNVIDTAAGLLAVSGTLDDRLGAYVILELLPDLGITCDWLLTTDEEIAQSTAEEFTHPNGKPYNWMFQFDRGGTDVVMYDYETPDLCDLVEDCGARVGMGSFSDICLLEHLECAGFNWGVGYQDYHSAKSHAWLEDTFRMVARFVKFYKANADKVLTHEPRDSYASVWGEVILGDCGHNIDLDDENTYVEVDGQLWCPGCGTMPDFTPIIDLEETA